MYERTDWADFYKRVRANWARLSWFTFDHEAYLCYKVGEGDLGAKGGGTVAKGRASRPGQGARNLPLLRYRSRSSRKVGRYRVGDRRVGSSTV